MGKPGIMLYFDILEPVMALSNTEKGRLLVAMLEYGQRGKNPKFEGKLALAWGFIRPRLDKDDAEYRQSVLRRQYATVCRERKRRGEPEVTFDQWRKTAEEEKESTVTNDDHWYPAADTAPTPTTATTENTTATAAAAATVSTAAAADSAVRAVGGKLGKNVVFLSQAQVADLLEKMDLESFDYYVDKLAEFIIRNEARVKNHYETILKWYREDGRTG